MANTGRPEAPLFATRLGDGDAMRKDTLTVPSFGAGTIPVLVTALGSDAAAVRQHDDALGHLGEDRDRRGRARHAGLRPGRRAPGHARPR